MADRYRDFANSALGKQVAGRLGLPRPPVLRRWSPGQQLLPGPAYVDAVSSPVLADVLTRCGATVSADAQRWAAVLVDATEASTVADLRHVYDTLAPRVRSVLPNGRVLVIGRQATPADSAEVSATRQAIDGVVRSLAKELRAGATANRIELAGGLGIDSVGVQSALRFVLSGKAAYVDGQPFVLGPSDAGAPADWDRPLANKVAVVTGAARGIGAAIAETLARDGASVVCADLPTAGEALAAVANRVVGTTLQLDITAGDAPAVIASWLVERFGGVDIVVHNAGITKDKLLANMSAAQWDSVLAVNLSAQLRINQALLDSGALRTGGRVISLSSTTGLAGNRGQTNYGASKAGILGMVRASAPLLAGSGATINAVLPGFIDTDMTQSMPLATREVARRLNSLQQAGLPIDVAEAVAWLASPGAGAMNGQQLRVCGQSLVGA